MSHLSKLLYEGAVFTAEPIDCNMCTFYLHGVILLFSKNGIRSRIL